MADSRTWLPFDTTEYERRQAALRARMDERGLDAVLLSGPENQYYLTGYETTGFHSFPQTLIFPRREPPLLVTRRLEQGNADAADALATALRDLGLADSLLGVEKATPWLIVRLYEGLRRALPTATLEDASG